ncbi:hypothetical protein MtrunA17_Chr8g0366371 [Medicago truncatula]|uniref:Uncharacterized protein n=1 Tax=Medicago truncatula TaxID=3880 RepID=A0A396GRT1_MEDTR|nr:hypothetical protein MtrunA17_Chr8g0366371 [Medicago truncatula]
MLLAIRFVVTGSAKKQTKEKPSVSSHNSNKSKSGSKARGSELAKYSKPPAKEDDEEVDDEEEYQGECTACGENYVSASDEF